MDRRDFMKKISLFGLIPMVLAAKSTEEVVTSSNEPLVIDRDVRINGRVEIYPEKDQMGLIVGRIR